MQKSSIIVWVSMSLLMISSFSFAMDHSASNENIKENTPPTIQFTSNPSVSGNIITAATTATDDTNVKRVSFAIFKVRDVSLNIKDTVRVTSPMGCTYSPTVSVNTWGYDPGSTTINKTVDTSWSIDISGLSDGAYYIMFYAGDGTVAKDTGYMQFKK
ncbi:MAG: hypothetical protein WC799_15220 [Desulfobacteraceae bacterium]|jgi:hypothetical protein